MVIQSRSPNAASLLASPSGARHWQIPQRALAVDALGAGCVLQQGEESHYLILADFRFEIPEGQGVLGAVAELLRRGTFGDDRAADAEVRLVVNGQIVGDDRSLGGDWPLSFAWSTHGGASDTWGLTLTPAIVNSPDFGIAIRAKDVPAGDVVAALIDAARLTVY
jgi:hypothetical protein